jgi:hypothetical protein
VHHTRKSGAENFLDTINGSQGLAGAADTVAVLRRSRGSAGAVLKITGRDVEEAELALNFDAAFGPGDYSTGRHLLRATHSPCTPVTAVTPPVTQLSLVTHQRRRPTSQTLTRHPRRWLGSLLKRRRAWRTSPDAHPLPANQRCARILLAGANLTSDPFLHRSDRFFN